LYRRKNQLKIIYNENSFSKRKRSDEVNNKINDNYKYRKAINYYNMILLSNDNLDEPESYKDISNRKDKKGWLEAIKTELNNMKNKKVYTFIKEVPEGKNVISTRWVFTFRRNDIGIITKYNARLLARSFSQ